MVNKSMISLNYARMTDDQLLNLARAEGETLTGDALALLQQEFIKRNLDTAVFSIIDGNKTLQAKEDIENSKQEIGPGHLNKFWKYALKEKKQGKLDGEIHNGLIGQGLDEEYALMITNTMEEKVKELIDKYDTKMLQGIFFFMLGLIVTLISYGIASTDGGVFFFTYGSILWGAYDFLIGVTKKGDFKAILLVIQRQQNARLRH